MTISYQHNEELPPGTSYLVDEAGLVRAKHDAHNQDIVLLPCPSKDPNDPLNWSPSRKSTQLFGLIIYTLTVGYSSAAIYSVLVPISTDSNITVTQLNNGTGYMFLLFGWGCLFWQALALSFGKRPVYLASLLLTIAVQAWGAYIDTNSMWILNKVLQGFVGAPIESLVEISISDVYFSHTRGRYMGVYALCLFLSNFIAPVFAGLMDASQGWQWVLKWGAIINAIGFVICFFTLEETNFDRRAALRSNLTTPPTSPRSIESNEEHEHGEEKVKGTGDDGDSSPKLVHQIEEYSPPAVNMDKQAITKSFTQRFFSLPRPSPHPLRLFTKCFYTPVLLLSVPIIFYSGFQYGINLVWFNILNATASSLLTAPPYNFGSVAVGLSYLSPSIGSSISTLGTGFLTDKLKIFLARRNGGYSEPEHRLWLFPLGMIMSPLALLCWGVGASYGLPWPFIVVMGMGLLAASLGLGASLAITYAIDCFQDLDLVREGGKQHKKSLQGKKESASNIKEDDEPHFEAIPCVMTAVILVRNTMSFGIGYGINPWIQGMGVRNCFITTAVIAWAAVVSWYIFIRYGKGMRIRGKERYLRLIGW